MKKILLALGCTRDFVAAMPREERLGAWLFAPMFFLDCLSVRVPPVEYRWWAEEGRAPYRVHSSAMWLAPETDETEEPESPVRVVAGSRVRASW